MAEANNSISLNIDRVQFGRNPDGTRLSPEKSDEKVSLWVERSARIRWKLMSVFDHFGVSLADSLDGKKDFPISIEWGGNSNNYHPQWSKADTGGMLMDYRYGDRQVWYAANRLDGARFVYLREHWSTIQYSSKLSRMENWGWVTFKRSQ